MKDNLDIKKKLSCLKVSRSDIVMLHVDSAISAQYKLKNNRQNINLLCKEIMEYFKPHGTVIVPTFTYSFTNKKKFNPQKSKSKVGLFTEIFRKIKNVSRTKHPIFSIAIYGKMKKELLKCSIKDCFGDGTFFDFLYKNNGKIICMGCDLDRITFIHYLEQKLEVPYRYFKFFDGSIVNKKKETKHKIRYFVRNLSLNLITDLSKLDGKKYKKYLGKIKFGRFYLKSISSKNLYKIGKSLIKKDVFSLTKKNEKI